MNYRLKINITQNGQYWYKIIDLILNMHIMCSFIELATTLLDIYAFHQINQLIEFKIPYIINIYEYATSNNSS